MTQRIMLYNMILYSVGWYDMVRYSMVYLPDIWAVCKKTLYIWNQFVVDLTFISTLN